MWQAPNQRVRAIASAKKRERERNKRPLHIKRVSAHVRLLAESSGSDVPEDATEVRLVLNDLTPKTVGLFSPVGFLPGQQVSVEMKDPTPLSIKGRVAWCQHDAGSHILSTDPYSFRLVVEFLFSSGDEQNAIKNFCDEVYKNHLLAVKAA